MGLKNSAGVMTILGLTLSACGPLSGNMQPVDFSGKSLSVDGASSATQALACLNNKVDYVLNTQVVDFEMEGGGGLKAGFAPSGTTLTELSVGVTYSTGQLDTNMVIQDPLKPGVAITQAGGSASQQNMSFEINATVSMVSFGPQVWYSTTISDLSNNALQDNLTNLTTQLNNLVPSNGWWTTVSQLNGTQGFFVPVGANAGIQVGDEFNVMDVTYEWGGDGTPCNGNELLMPLINSTKPKAVAKVQSVDVDYAYMVFESQAQPINLNDYVAISKLTPSTATQAACTNFLGIGCPSAPSTVRTTLARSIRVGNISSQPLPFVGQSGVAQYVDITPFVQTQLAALLPQNQFGGFFVHQ